MAYDYINDGNINADAIQKGIKGNKKARMLQLLRMLNEETDEDHPLSTNEIIDRMKDLGLDVNRKTVKDDVDLLIASGYDVVIVKSSNNSFFMGERIFELSELKLMVDAISASKIISTKATNSLIEKLQKLCSKYQAQELLWNRDINKNIKPYSKLVNLTIDKLTRAIGKKRRINFKYNEYNIKKELQARHDGKVYDISPYFLVWNEDHYYLVGYENSTRTTKTFRIDRIDGSSLTISKEQAVRKPDRDLLSKYSQRAFSMMANEENERTVVLRCRNKLITIMIDRFGEEVDTKQVDDGHFDLTTKLYVTTNFFSWLARFGDDIQVVSPPQVVQDYKEYIQKILKQYK
ncbi:hypothetical protein D081_0754 [Anaerovibrio sp. JC8]|uniref:helix-turn-helix transcriptional regulator n=1 Tax=Anaerovibrio sp. JC8 TaxID=1240085 RepID=UPI000A0D8B25|nr:WYL domain-containing protein [Anaerovibrio sp. JC8]ORU00772.1 hypothetical protein D081_0754 [Anaerovibrio sp. JC8]